MTQLRAIGLLLAVLMLLVYCNTERKTATNTDSASKKTPATNAQNETPKIPAGQPFKQPGDLAASHILITYTGASRANPKVTRTKEEAKIKANQLLVRLQEEPELFEEMAKLESDGPSAPKGGSLGIFQKGAMVKPFEDALNGIEIGKITPAPVETNFGYHIIRRDTLEKLFWAAEAFVVAFKGSRAPPEVTRTQDEAKAFAEELKGKLTHDNFAQLAAEHNDLNSGAPIFLGAFSTDNAMSPKIIESLKGLEFGQASGYIEMPFGFTFLRRVPVEQRAGSHILISYKGAQNAKPTIKRSKEEAQIRAQELISELENNISSFPEFAKKYSDGPSGPSGGSLGIWFKGKMVPAFETALDTMAPGTITPQCVETDFGFHIIRREQPEN